MKSLATFCVVHLLWANFGYAADVPPPNDPPNLWRASAITKDGRVAIQLARPKYQTPRIAGPAEAMEWEFLPRVTLGKSASAFKADGKPMASDVLAKKLRRASGVVVFVRFYEPLLEPDPFYLNMIREGTVILVVSADALGPPIP
ncbi:MAG: hypothetical protein AAGI63_16630 [Planctomycetota bacterium]